MWTTLNFKDSSKTEKRAGDICKMYRIWTGLASVYSTDSKLKNNFLVSWIFFRKKQYHIVGCRKYYKPIKFDQNCWCHFWENRIFYFYFLMWTTINFRGWGKIKNKRPRIFAEDPRYRISTISVNWFRRNVRQLSQRQTVYGHFF